MKGFPSALFHSKLAWVPLPTPARQGATETRAIGCSKEKTNYCFTRKSGLSRLVLLHFFNMMILILDRNVPSDTHMTLVSQLIVCSLRPKYLIPSPILSICLSIGTQDISRTSRRRRRIHTHPRHITRLGESPLRGPPCYLKNHSHNDDHYLKIGIAV